MLSLSDEQTIVELAGVLYDYLPATAHPYAPQTRTFETVAHALGLVEFWPGGSKRPAITELLRRTLDLRRDRFCALILAIVREGLSYREKKANPVTRHHIVMLHELLSRVQFQIPELVDPDFLNRLPCARPPDERARTPPRAESLSERLGPVRLAFRDLARDDPQRRGFGFERFLNDLFAVCGLSPRGPFKLRGEQIDGSIELDRDTYLIEAKWQQKPVGFADLATFRAKVEGKTAWTRGLFISMSGFTTDGLDAHARGRSTNLIAMDGLDLQFVLEDRMPLVEALRRKVDWAGQTGQILIHIHDLLIDGTG